MNIHYKPFKKQTGVVLVISLVMLLLLTIIAVSGMQSISMAEKMAGNMGDHYLAFQAAETAVRHAEQFIENQIANPDSPIGFRLAASKKWIPQGPFDLSETITGLSSQPSYTITPMLWPNFYGADTVYHSYALFQIKATARGSNNATVKLLTIYRIEVPRYLGLL